MAVGQRNRASLTPVPDGVAPQLDELGDLGLRPPVRWPVVVEQRFAVRRDQHQRIDPFGGGRRDEHLGAARAVDPDEGGVPDLLGVHDGEDVLGLLFDRGHVVDGIGEPETAALEVDGARIGGESFEERVHVRIGPQQVQMHLDLEEPHDVGRARSDHPVGQIVTVAGQIPGHRRIHQSRLSG